MKIAARENFRFTDKRLALGLAICLAWGLADVLRGAESHWDRTGVASSLTGLASMACVIWAILGKTRQCLFLLLTAVIAILIAVRPFVSVAR